MAQNDCSNRHDDRAADIGRKVRSQKIAGPTMSSGFLVRPSGVWSRKIFTTSGLLLRTCSFNGVSICPRPMALARTVVSSKHCTKRKCWSAARANERSDFHGLVPNVPAITNMTLRQTLGANVRRCQLD